MKKKKLNSKTPKQSEVQMTELVLPSHTISLGGIFGGQVMSWIDIAAAIAAQRHSEKVCVTASVDELHFLNPIKIGYVVNIRARITAVHKTSCEVQVKVSAENPRSGENFHTSLAYLTFVALGENGKPSAMPPLKTQTKDEKQLEKEALIRREHRKKLKETLYDQ